MRVLIAYDGSDHAKAAIEDLRRAGLRHRTRAVVVAVSDTLLPVPSLSDHVIIEMAQSRRVSATLFQAQAEAVQAIEEARALAHEGQQKVRARFPEWEVDLKPVVGAPAQAVMQVADDWDADLIVVGSHGRSALRRLVLGSISRHIATESRRSVRVARHVVDRGSRRVRIIVGVDGSRGANAAVHSVVSRPWPPGTEVRLVIADDRVRTTATIGLVPTAAAWVMESNDVDLAQACAMLEDAARGLIGAGLHVSASIKKGSAPDILKDEAQTWEADCIIVGAQTCSPTLDRFCAGTVSTTLVSTSPCSVEIVRAVDARPDQVFHEHPAR
jgi:nucleotide-binding universal stress UspA family protein